MRRAAATDRNHGTIRDCLRKVGCHVTDLSGAGNGVPDLLVSRAGQSWLLEVKDPMKPPSARALTPKQRDWHNAYLGGNAYVVETCEQALNIVGLSRMVPK